MKEKYVNRVKILLRWSKNFSGLFWTFLEKNKLFKFFSRDFSTWEKKIILTFNYNCPEKFFFRYTIAEKKFFRYTIPEKKFFRTVYSFFRIFLYSNFFFPIFFLFFLDLEKKVQKIQKNILLILLFFQHFGEILSRVILIFPSYLGWKKGISQTFRSLGLRPRLQKPFTRCPFFNLGNLEKSNYTWKNFP